MDTSETYIKMCEKATEIQTIHKWDYGDWLIAEYGVFQIGTACFHYSSSKDAPPVRSEKPVATIQSEGVDGEIFSGSLIWLPRQDQLQEIYAKWVSEQLEYTQSEYEIKVAFLDFAEWLNKQYQPEPFTNVPTNNFSSGEQLWMAFIQQEIHDKVWDGNDWILTTG